MHHNNSGLRAPRLLAIMLMLTQAFASKSSFYLTKCFSTLGSAVVVKKTITGAGYKNTETMTGLPYLSMAGGAPILLKGLNFAS